MLKTVTYPLTIRPVQIIQDGQPLTHEQAWHKAPPPNLEACEVVAVEACDANIAGWAVFEDRGTKGLALKTLCATSKLAFASF